MERTPLRSRGAPIVHDDHARTAQGIDVRRLRDPVVMLKPTSPSAESSLLDAIAAGDLDDHLDALAAAVYARRELLHTVRSATKLMSLCEGELVVINDRISPRYLAGLWGEVVDVDEGAATIQLVRPVGRFHTGRVRVPPLALDKLSPAA